MRTLIALLLLLPALASAATFYVDLSGAGSGAANGSSVSNQCAGPGDADCAPAAGDTVYFCNAGTSALVLNTAGDSNNRITYDWSCPGGTPGSLSVASGTPLTLGLSATYHRHLNAQISTSGTGSCVFINSSDYITFEDSTFGPCGQRAINVSTGSDVDGLVVDGSTFTEVDETCIALVDTSIAGAYSDWSLTDNSFTGCNTDSANDTPSVRITVASGAATTIERFTFTGNTLSGNATTHGLTLGNQNAPSCSAGTCAARLNTVVDAVINDNVISGGFAGFNLRHLLRGEIRRNRFTNTTGAGGGVIMFYSEGAVASHNYCAGLTTDTIDGGCLDLDHGNFGVTLHSNECYDISGKDGVFNSGYCVMILDSRASKVYANVGARIKYGVFIGNNQGLTTDPNLVANNVFVGSSAADVYLTSTVTANMTTIYNNIFSNSAGYSIDNQAGVDQTVNFNLIYSPALGAYFQQTAGASDITGQDPLLVGGGFAQAADFMLLPASPARKAGVCHLGVGCIYPDFRGYRPRVPPDMGAYQRQ